MQPSKDCYDLIKQFEGCSLHAYPDPATNGAPYTIGYGHTGGVSPNDTITGEQADAFLQHDLERFSEQINKLLKISVTQNEFDALCCFAFNVGTGNLANSTLLKKINMGDKDAAANEFPKWNKAAGKIMGGLIKRREAERKLFKGEQNEEIS